MTNRAPALTCVFGLMGGIALVFSQPPTAPNLFIMNGQLIDGTGAAARQADVRIAGDSIVAVGASLAPAAGDRVIDVHGAVVAPGFIDMHSHADRGIEATPDATSQVMQGITTAVVGQDGGG